MSFMSNELESLALRIDNDPGKFQIDDSLHQQESNGSHHYFCQLPEKMPGDSHGHDVT